jgi:hypothetical protein
MPIHTRVITLYRVVICCYNYRLPLLIRATASRTNPLTPELNPSEQRSLPRFFTGDFKAGSLKGLSRSAPYLQRELTNDSCLVK